MKKRHCKRFNVPGTTLRYKKRRNLFGKTQYTRDHFPVVNLSRGGAKFVCHNRLKVGTGVSVLLEIPSIDRQIEINSTVRWVARNPEESYRYQVGISFSAYGKRKNENPIEILEILKKIENEFAKGSEIA
ncbi:MAG: PilZ domain-containing protein [Desulfobacteraceae bacterium]